MGVQEGMSRIGLMEGFVSGSVGWVARAGKAGSESGIVSAAVTRNVSHRTVRLTTVAKGDHRASCLVSAAISPVDPPRSYPRHGGLTLLQVHVTTFNFLLSFVQLATGLKCRYVDSSNCTAGRGSEEESLSRSCRPEVGVKR